jgi:hypothetical protein
VDNKQLYTVSFTDYPQNMDRLLRFTKAGLLLDLNIGNVLINNYSKGKNNDDFQFANTSANITVEKVDTVYRIIPTDTALVRIPVLQRKVIGKTLEEQAREAADQLFEIRTYRYETLTKYLVDFKSDGAALKYAIQSLDIQEERLLSLFSGVKIESRQIVTYMALPEKPATSAVLFHFSERAGIVNKNTAGAEDVWYDIGKVVVPPSITPNQQANDIIYYRMPQIVEISAGVDKNTLVKEQVTVCQFGNIVSFPLVAPPKK